MYYYGCDLLGEFGVYFFWNIVVYNYILLGLVRE